MSEKDEKKVKGFRIPISAYANVEKIIKDSGKEPGEWFEDVIQQIQTNQLVLDKSEISDNLRSHFGSDVSALKEATTLIQQLFINQMNRIAVEKNTWNQHLKNTVVEYEQKIRELQKSLQELEDRFNNNVNDLHLAKLENVQLENKIDGFDKLEAQLRKDIERLEGENAKNKVELQQVREDALQERDKQYKDMELLRSQHKEDKDGLNQQIVDLVNQLNATEPIKHTNVKLQEKVKELELLMKQSDRDYELHLTRAQEQAELDKEKALTLLERKLRDELYYKSREDTKELYEKIEKLQLENQELRIQNNSINNEKKDN